MDALNKDVDDAFCLVRLYLSREVGRWYAFDHECLKPASDSEYYRSDEELISEYKTRLAFMSKAMDDISAFIQDFEKVEEPEYPNMVKYPEDGSEVGGGNVSTGVERGETKYQSFVNPTNAFISAPQDSLMAYDDQYRRLNYSILSSNENKGAWHHVPKRPKA
ncbi:hypothetical protein BT69DRAFT_1342846 [Atractiella rhizophila]|nr:hypothetical protein BT69DRAFT_1342846 [Atractiella rhizophila]